MSSNNNLGRKNPLLQRVRRHTEMAMLFRSPGSGYRPTWTAEVVHADAPQVDAIPLSQEAMEIRQPFSPDTPTTPQPIATQPTVQRQTAEQPTPTLWQRAKTLFRQEAAPTSISEPTNPAPAVEPTTPATSHQPPATNTDTYGIIQRQPMDSQLSGNSNQFAGNREVSGASYVPPTSAPIAEARKITVSQLSPTQPPYAAGDTYTTLQRQPATPATHYPTAQPISNLQSPISRSEAAHSPNRPTTPDSDFPWSPLQAIYNSHHPEAARKATAVAPVTTPTTSSQTVQRQVAPSVVPSDGSFPWGALQNIYNVHQKVMRQEKEAPNTGHNQRSEMASPSPEPHLPAQAVPLQDIWPVEKTAKSETTTAAQPSPSLTTPIQRTATDHAQDAQVRAKLEGVTPARPSDSSVELVTPRRPRPMPPGTKTVASPTTPKALQRQEKSQPTKPATDLSDTTVETEIGPLPADLWNYIGAEPPVSDPVPTKTITTKSAADTAVQRAIVQAEAPAAEDTPLPTAFLIPISNEPVATIIPLTNQRREQESETVGEQRSDGDFTPTDISQSPANSEPELAVTHEPTVAGASAQTIQRAEQKSSQAAEMFSKENSSSLPAHPTAPQPLAADVIIQRAIAFAEASPARQEKMVHQPATTGLATVIAPIQRQTTVAQREIGTTQTAKTTTRVTPTSEPTQSPIASSTAAAVTEPTGATHFPINARPAMRATAVAPISPTAPASVQWSTQSTAPHSIQREVVSDSAPLAPNTPASEITETTAGFQATTTQPAIQTSPASTNTAVHSSPATAQAIIQAQAPSNGRSIQRQTEAKVTVQPTAHHTTPNPSGFTEQIQRAIATAAGAPVINVHQTGYQQPDTVISDTTKQNNVLWTEPATSNQIPTIQRTEAETAVTPEPPSINNELPALSTEPPNTNEPKTAEPDIEELARQVYSDLKRRLTIEWERNRGRIIA